MEKTAELVMLSILCVHTINASIMWFPVNGIIYQIKIRVHSSQAPDKNFQPASNLQ